MPSPLRLGLSLLGLALLAACGGGGGGEPEPLGQPPDVSGWWLLEHDDLDDALGWRAVDLRPLEDDGTEVLYDRMTLAKADWSLDGATPSADHPHRRALHLEILSADVLSGEETWYDGGIPARRWAVRLTRTDAPMGRLTGTGSVGGHAVDVENDAAYAAEYDDAGAFTYVELHATTVSGAFSMHFAYQTTGPIPAGAYDVGGLNDEIGVFATLVPYTDAGESGNVVLTQSNTTRVAGWYIVTLTSGEMVSGSFDAPVRVRGPWPW